MEEGTANSKMPKADLRRMVKEFRRSAAGQKINVAEFLRPPEVLLHTIKYLMQE